LHIGNKKILVGTRNGDIYEISHPGVGVSGKE